MNFVRETYTYAYTQGPLPVQRRSKRDDEGYYEFYMEDFKVFLNYFFLTTMEENYHTMTQSIGLISDPVDGYYIVLTGSILALTMPCWMPFYFYLCYTSIYKVWVTYSENSSRKKLDDFENDPDFEQEEDE